jgi:hypothetical protein
MPKVIITGKPTFREDVGIVLQRPAWSSLRFFETVDRRMKKHHEVQTLIPRIDGKEKRFPLNQVSSPLE